MVRMVRMVRSLADRTFQLCLEHEKLVHDLLDVHAVAVGDRACVALSPPLLSAEAPPKRDQEREMIQKKNGSRTPDRRDPEVPRRKLHTSNWITLYRSRENARLFFFAAMLQRNSKILLFIDEGPRLLFQEDGKSVKWEARIWYALLLFDSLLKSEIRRINLHTPEAMN